MAEPAASEAVFLQPGDLFTGDRPTRVKTVLGSCVAITIRDRRLGFAAMTHCLLPEAGAPADALPPTLALRFVDTAIDRMLAEFASRGARLGDLEVKLFGGADGLSANVGSDCHRVGKRNVDAALAGLAARGINPTAAGVGGRNGRVIEFDTASGEVLVRQLPRPPRPMGSQL